MATPRAVHGLTHQYARLAGQVQALRARNCRLQGVIDAKAKLIAETETEIVAINEQMDALRRAALAAFDTDISATEARKTWPKAHISSWGALTRTLLRQLSMAGGVPMTTAELSLLGDRELDLGLDESGLSRLKQQVRYRLKALRQRGLVLRVSESKGFGEYSTWVIGDTAV